MSIVDQSYDINKPYFQNHSYMEWLISFTIDETIQDDQRPTFKRLLLKLWEIPFTSSLGNDEDRASDGLNLRIRYDHILSRNSGISHSVDAGTIFGECRVLEMLIALSMQMYDIMQDTGEYDSVSRWFWEIMANVGMDDLDDECYDICHGDVFVETMVTDILARKGRKNWPGGWFFVQDWQSKEIWYQMHEYLGQYFE